MILLFFSEFYFLNEGPVINVIDTLEQSPLEIIPSFIEFTLFYALFAYLFLFAIEHYPVKTITGLFLAGAFFGWATEGVIIPIVYEAPPFSFIFPSVSWHAIVDVLFGWYIIRRVMRTRNLYAIIALFVVTGAVWGGWATWFWAEPETLQPITPERFMSYTMITSLLWIIGMIILDRFGTVDFLAGKWEVRIVLGISAFFFLSLLILYLPLSLLLPPLIWCTHRALNRTSANAPNAPDIIRPVLRTPPPLWTYALAILTPLTATAVYPLFFDAGRGIPTEDITATLFIVGLIALLVGLIRPFLKRK